MGNRLVTMKADSSGQPGTTAETYRYHGLNRRIRKTGLFPSTYYEYYFNESWQLLYSVCQDGGEWKRAETTMVWRLHGGENRLEARSVNKFDVAGPVSTVVLTATE